MIIPYPTNLPNPTPASEAFYDEKPDIISGIVHEFSEKSWWYQNCPIRQLNNGNGPGATMRTEFIRLLNKGEAVARAFNEEVPPTRIQWEKATAYVKMLGASYELDRAMLGAHIGADTYVEQQMGGAERAVINLLNDMVINGDSSKPLTNDHAICPSAFDGLDKLVVEYDKQLYDSSDDVIDLTGLLQTKNKAGIDVINVYAEELDKLFYTIDNAYPKPDWLLANKWTIRALKSLCRLPGQWQVSSITNEWGDIIDSIGNLKLIDMGIKANSMSEPVIGLKRGHLPEGFDKVRDGTEVDKAISSSIYYGSFDELDGVNAISDIATGVNHIPPDFEAPGYVHKGDIALHYGIMVKNRNAVGCIKNIILPSTIISQSNPAIHG